MTHKQEVKAKESVKEYNGVFKGTGRLPLKLRVDAEPVIHPARKFPVAIKKRLKQKLDTPIKENIIRKVEEPTE